MRNIVACVTLFSSLGASLWASPVLDLIKQQTGKKIELVKEIPIKTDKNLKLIVIKDSETGESLAAITNASGNVFMGVSSVFYSTDKDVVNTVVKEALESQGNNRELAKRTSILEAIKAVPDHYVVNLKSTTDAKKTIYIVSDPSCPHCQEELKGLEDRLKVGNVKMIVIGWLNSQSAYKAKEIHDRIKTAKSEQDKIGILREVYSPSHVSKSTDVTMVTEITKNLTGPGKVEGVPYIVEVEE